MSQTSRFCLKKKNSARSGDTAKIATKSLGKQKLIKTGKMPLHIIKIILILMNKPDNKTCLFKSSQTMKSHVLAKL